VRVGSPYDRLRLSLGFDDLCIYAHFSPARLCDLAAVECRGEGYHPLLSLHSKQDCRRQRVESREVRAGKVSEIVVSCLVLLCFAEVQDLHLRPGRATDLAAPSAALALRCLPGPPMHA
jgi:hypothetical protein